MAAVPGAQTFVADQVVYDSSSSDGNVTIHAGIVSQGTEQFDISAARIPGGDRVYEVQVPLSVTTVNAALSGFAFSYDATAQSVTVENTASTLEKETLRNNLLDSRTYDRNARAALSAAVLKAISEQIASDIPDEFRSGAEAVRRLGLTLDAIDQKLAINPENASYGDHLLFNVANNLKETVWALTTPDKTQYGTYGSQLLRNIVLAIAERKPSRFVPSKQLDAGTDEIPEDLTADPPQAFVAAVPPAPVGQNVKLVAGDEIVVYVTYTGELRVAAGRELERFGRSQTELESQSVNGRVLDLDGLAWVKLVLRAVV